MTEEPTTHVHMADDFRVFTVRGMPDFAVLQITSRETGERFRFGLPAVDLAGLAERLRLDAKLLNG